MHSSSSAGKTSPHVVRIVEQLVKNCRWILPNDLHRMIQFQRSNEISQIDKIVQRYKIKQQFPEAHSQLLNSLKEAAASSKADLNPQNEQTLTDLFTYAQKEREKQLQLLKNRKNPINSEQEFFDILRQTDILVQFESVIRLYKASENLGYEHFEVQKLLKNFISVEFRSQVEAYLRRIQEKKAMADLRAQVQQILLSLPKKLKEGKGKAVDLIIRFYAGNAETFRQILVEQGVEQVKIDEMEKRLKYILVNVDQQFRSYFGNKVIELMKANLSEDEKLENVNGSINKSSVIEEGIGMRVGQSQYYESMINHDNLIQYDELNRPEQENDEQSQLEIKQKDLTSLQSIQIELNKNQQLQTPIQNQHIKSKYSSNCKDHLSQFKGKNPFYIPSVHQKQTSNHLSFVLIFLSQTAISRFEILQDIKNDKKVEFIQKNIKHQHCLIYFLAFQGCKTVGRNLTTEYKLRAYIGKMNDKATYTIKGEAQYAGTILLIVKNIANQSTEKIDFKMLINDSLLFCIRFILSKIVKQEKHPIQKNMLIWMKWIYQKSELQIQWPTADRLKNMKISTKSSVFNTRYILYYLFSLQYYQIEKHILTISYSHSQMNIQPIKIAKKRYREYPFYKYLRQFYDQIYSKYNLLINRQTLQLSLIKYLKEGKFKASQFGKIHQIAHNSLNNENLQIFKQQYQRSLKKYQQRKKSFYFAIQILKDYNQKFKSQIQNLKRDKTLMDSELLSNAYKQIQGREYNYFLQCSSIIYQFRSYERWKVKQMNCIDQITKQYDDFLPNIWIALQSFVNKEITYKTYKQYFGIPSIDKILQHLQRQNQAILRYHLHLSESQMHEVLRYSKSVNKILSLIKSEREMIDIKKLNYLYELIGSNNWQFSVHILLEEIEKAEIALCNVLQVPLQKIQSEPISSILKYDVIAQITVKTYEAEQMLPLIDWFTSNSQVIDDLKDYINEEDSINLAIDTIKDCELVVRYWRILKSVKNLEDWRIKISNFCKKNQNISLSIENCFAHHRTIQQKKNEAANREISFKYKLNSMLQDSEFFLNQSQQIWIDIKIKDMKVSYKELANYRDKSILFNRYIPKQYEDDKILQETMKVFNLYEQMFHIVQAIQFETTRLIKYGYHPKLISKNIEIKGENLSKLNQFKQELQTLSSQWTIKIIDAYSHSPLLTHFRGKELSCFIQCFYQGRYHPSLYYIIGLSQDQYQKSHFVQNKRKQVNGKKITQKLPYIVSAFAEFENKIQLKQKTQNYRQVLREVKHINLITCAAEYFYCCLFQKDYKTSASQVLFCHKDMHFEQIELFLLRSFMNSQKKHYIVGPHFMQDQVKHKTCDFLLELRNKRKEDFSRADLTFIDNSTNDILYLFLVRPNHFFIKKHELQEPQAREKTFNMINHLQQTEIITSAKAGLGKTFVIEKKAREINLELKRLPVCGNIDFSSLSRRLKRLNVEKEQCLLIQVGHVENWHDLQIFLSQIILFRCFEHEEYIFLPQQTIIYIQIQNIFSALQNKQLPYNILQILKRNKRLYNIQSFDLKSYDIKYSSKDDKFVILSLLKKDLKYSEYSREQTRYSFPENWFGLLEKHFLRWFKDNKVEPTFYQLRSFFNLLFEALKTFSDSPFFFKENLRFINNNSQKSREIILEILIKNSLQFIVETVNSNDFIDKKVGLQNLKDKIRNFPLLIIPTASRENYEFVYLNDQNVSNQIKTLLLSQNLLTFKKIKDNPTENNISTVFKQTALNTLQKTNLMLKIYDTIYTLSQNKNFFSNLSQPRQRLLDIEAKVPKLKDYKITLDNFFKMCMIIHRSRCRLPCIIMGQSGVGKTALIEFLVRVALEEELVIHNVHAGIHEAELGQWIQQIQKKAVELNAEGKKLWVFFDEFNTSDQLSYIKQILVDRRFQGYCLPDNVIFVAACNPYRKYSNQQQGSAFGLFKRVDSSNLVFKVKPPGLSTIQFMWDYQQLGKEENLCYITQILSSINFNKIDKVIEVIAEMHQTLKSTLQISSASLRDVVRFKQIYEWFMQYMPHSTDAQEVRRQPNFNIDRTQRAILLSLAFCYVLRFSSLSKRREYLSKIQGKMGCRPGYIEQMLQNEQTQYVRELILPEERIAMNSALRENIFVSLICLMNTIPILIIGKPGCSKSLSIKLLASNLRGENSKSAFCRQFPELNIFYYQGSVTSTSQGIEQIYEKAVEFRSLRNRSTIKNCILFDEIGLAEASVHNPLKVLHSKLEIHRKEQISFIGISNWKLDAAKMSRFLILSRSQLDESDLKLTARQIYESYRRYDLRYFRKIEQLSTYYDKFMYKWKEVHPEKSGFFGLRDFYSCIKFVSSKITDSSTLQEFNEFRNEAININFDGQEDSLKIFYNCMQDNCLNGFVPDPLKLIKRNLHQNDSRCLLLIVKGEALVPLLNRQILLQRVVSLHGSTFKQDQQSEQYNTFVTSKIISQIWRGSTIIFKDINASIQSSLYDLFNRAYTTIGLKQYCRIAVGANSNAKCYVHQDFRALIIVHQKNLRKLDLPFLNRFEKHYLTFNQLLTQDQKVLLAELKKWLKRILDIREESSYKRQNFIVNSCNESLASLIISLRSKQNILNLAKRKLLQNSTTDFYLYQIDNQALSRQIKDLMPDPQLYKKCTNDMIIFTYDQFNNFSTHNRSFVRLSQINSEKMLKVRIKQGLLEEASVGLDILLNFASSFQHLNYVLFMVREIKVDLKSQKQVRVIIQLQRFTLHQLKIDSINVSYLHPHQQFFVQTLVSGSPILPIMSDSHQLTYWKLYAALQLKSKLQHHLLSSLSLAKFSSQIQPEKSLNSLYIDQFRQVFKENSFLNEVVAFLQKYLQTKQMSFSALQFTRQQILSHSNFKEAISELICSEVIQILFYFLRMLVDRGLLFHFRKGAAIEAQHDKAKQYLINQNNEANQDISNYFQHILKSQTSILLTSIPTLKEQRHYQGQTQSNRMCLQQITLLPGVYQDFDNLFESDRPDHQSLEKMAVLIPHQMNEQNKQQYQQEVFKCRQFLRERFHIFKQGQSFLQSAHIFKLYLYDVLNYMFAKWNIVTDKGSFYLQCLEILCFQQSLDFIIIILVENTKITQEFLHLLTLILAQSNEEELVKDFYKERSQNVSKKMQYLLDKSRSYFQISKNKDKICQSPKIYFEQFREVYKKMRSIVINSRRKDVKIGDECRQSYQFFEIIIKINKIQLLRDSEIIEMNEGNRFINSYHILARQLDTIQTNHQNIILNYMSITFFCEWILALTAQKKNDKNDGLLFESQKKGEGKACLNYFAQLCNKHLEFANNANIFLQMCFKKAQNMKGMISICKYLDETINLNQHIHFLNPFTQVLVNFIYSKILRFLISPIAEIDNLKILINSQYKSITGILSIEFVKIFGEKYAEILQKKADVKFLKQVDLVLIQQSIIAKNVRLYLFCLLFDKHNKSLERLKQRYLDINRCEWIRRVKDDLGIIQIEPKFMNQFNAQQERLLSGYPCIKLFKIAQLAIPASGPINILNEVKHHPNIKDYPLLTYLIQNGRKLQKLELLFTVFIFLSKIMRTFNYNITRQESKRSLKLLFSQEGKENEAQIGNQIQTFVLSWNSLSAQFQLSKTISASQPMSYFFYDEGVASSNLSNCSEFVRKGIAFYNNIFTEIQQLLTVINGQNAEPILSSVELIVNCFTEDVKFIKSPKQMLSGYFKTYRAKSIQEGSTSIYYPFHHIQALITKEFEGCRSLKDEGQTFRQIIFVGQEAHFIVGLRKNSSQRLIGKEELNRIEKWERDMLTDSERYKKIKRIQKELQFVIVVFKNCQPSEKVDQINLKAFVERKDLKNMTESIVLDPFAEVKLCYLADLYERVELQAYVSIIEPMCPGITDFSIEDERILNNMMTQLKDRKESNYLSCQSLGVALYRLAGRFLILKQGQAIPQKALLKEEYWPKDIDMRQVQQLFIGSPLQDVTLDNIGPIIRVIERYAREEQKASESQVHEEQQIDSDYQIPY